MATSKGPQTVVGYQGVEFTDHGKFYLFGDDERLISVTTVTDVVAKEGLVRWSASLAAEAAFVELPSVLVASRRKECGNTWIRCRGSKPDQHDFRDRCERCPCDECKACVQKWVADRHIAVKSRRADEGTRMHDVAEWWSLHGEIKPFDEDITPYVKAFQAFIAEYGITPEDWVVSEAIVVNRKHRYAGTTDGLVRIHAERTVAAAKLVSRITQIGWKECQKRKLSVLLVVDFKTREGEEPSFYPEQALQLTGYRHAETVRIKNTDIEEPMPATDGAMLVQLRPDGFSPRLAITTEDTFNDGFLHALGLQRWLIESGPAAISSRSFVLPETVKARARKAAAAVEKPADAAEFPVNGTPAAEPATRKNATGTRPGRKPALTHERPADPFALVGGSRGAGGVADDDIPF